MAIPETVQLRTRRRIEEYAAKHFAGRFTRLDIRFRGIYCYIDAYQEPQPPFMDPPEGETREQYLDRLRNTPIHLCRLGYPGTGDKWSFFYYTYAQEKYERSFLLTGDHLGTPEEALETSAMFR